MSPTKKKHVTAAPEPGGWTVEKWVHGALPAPTFFLKDAEGHMVAKFHNGNEDAPGIGRAYSRADLCSAALEMREALEEAEFAIGNLVEDSDPTLMKIRAALKKARGEE